MSPSLNLKSGIVLSQILVKVDYLLSVYFGRYNLTKRNFSKQKPSELIEISVVFSDFKAVTNPQDIDF